APTTSEISRRSQYAFDRLAEAGWHVAKLQVDSSWLVGTGGAVMVDSEQTTVLRSCVMKPEQLAVADEFADAVISFLADGSLGSAH
ncbi:MAG: hypothetical protein M3306_28910, partial [Actinomycetota bacterium]|nr:hypothetical protein [Actinomycetota bacterium]